MTFNRLMGVTAFAITTLGIPQPSLAGASGGAHRADGDPWAVGYAVEVARSCPGWKVEPQRTLARRGVLPGPGSDTGLMALDGPFQRDYYRGQADAQADRARRTDFCRSLRRIAGSRWARLARVLVPVGAHPEGR